jgi:hypothetical protein
MTRVSVRILLVLVAAATALFGIQLTGSAASPNLFASVSGTGTIINGNATSVTHIGIGRYEVTFGSDVSACAYVSTTHNAFSQALQSYTAGGHLSVNGVYVETKNQGGGLTDGPFDLAVACNIAGWDYAVVGYTANLVRSTPGATMTHPGQGRDRITFPNVVNNCSFLATVGDPANAIALNPSGVYTGIGPGTQTVYVETKNPGGGLQNGIPFHLAVVCGSAASVKTIVARDSGLATHGSALTSSFNMSTGNYVVVTNQNLSACTMIATRGSVDRSVPFNPATVEITPGPASNTSGIQIRALLALDTNTSPTNQSFHAAAIC